MQVPIEVEQVNHWLVLDGPLESGVVEALEMLVKGEGLTLPNRDTLLLPRMCTTCTVLCYAYACVHIQQCISLPDSSFS